MYSCLFCSRKDIYGNRTAENIKPINHTLVLLTKISCIIIMLGNHEKVFCTYCTIRYICIVHVLTYSYNFFMLGTCIFMLETTSITASKQIHFYLKLHFSKILQVSDLYSSVQALMYFCIAHYITILKAHTYVWSIDILHDRIDIDVVHNV